MTRVEILLTVKLSIQSVLVVYTLASLFLLLAAKYSVVEVDFVCKIEAVFAQYYNSYIVLIIVCLELVL